MLRAHSKHARPSRVSWARFAHYGAAPWTLVAALTPCSVRELALVPGVDVTAVFKASAAHLIPYRDYSMISSICASNAGEIVNLSACAVFRLITA